MSLFNDPDDVVDALRASATTAELADESAAVELAGASPRLIEGHGGNLKITYPQDLALAEALLAAGMHA